MHHPSWHCWNTWFCPPHLLSILSTSWCSPWGNFGHPTKKSGLDFTNDIIGWCRKLQNPQPKVIIMTNVNVWDCWCRSAWISEYIPEKRSRYTIIIICDNMIAYTRLAIMLCYNSTHMTCIYKCFWWIIVVNKLTLNELGEMFNAKMHDLRIRDWNHELIKFPNLSQAFT